MVARKRIAFIQAHVGPRSTEIFCMFCTRHSKPMRRAFSTGEERIDHA